MVYTTAVAVSHHYEHLRHSASSKSPPRQNLKLRTRISGTPAPRSRSRSQQAVPDRDIGMGMETKQMRGGWFIMQRDTPSLQIAICKNRDRRAGAVAIVPAPTRGCEAQCGGEQGAPPMAASYNSLVSSPSLVKQQLTIPCY